MKQLKTVQELISFYTLVSRDVNIYSQFPKKFKAILKEWKWFLTLPNQPYIFPISDYKPDIKTNSLTIQYSGTPSEEQKYILSILQKRIDIWYYAWLINMKTWRWKSHIIMGLTSLLWTKTLILCHNVKTLLEMKDKFKEFTNYEPWLFYWKEKNLKDITIMTHDSFVDMDWVSEKYFETIIYDECDFNLSQKMLDSLCNSKAKALYWLSWTPYTKNFNNNDMQKIYWKQIIYQEEDSSTGYNVLPEIHTYRYNSPSFKLYEYQNWAEEKQCLVNDNERLKSQIDLIKYYITKWRKTILILTERVEEAENYSKELLEHFKDTSINVQMITGKTKIKDDNNFISKHIGTGISIIIWTVWKMARWVDIPQIDTVMLFCALHFKWTVIQAVWRGLRNCSTKDKTILVDWQDYPILATQWYQRKKAYIKEYKIEEKDILFYNITNWQYVQNWR